MNILTLCLIQDGILICKRLWEGLTNQELYGLVDSPRAIKKEDSPILSPYQSTLLDIAHGRIVSDTKILFELEQRGLIERANEMWCIFSEVLRQFVLMQEEAIEQAKTGVPTAITS